MSSDLNDLDPELRTFIRNAREVFRGESWDRVRYYLERVWFNSGLARHAGWTEVEARVKSEWKELTK